MINSIFAEFSSFRLVKPCLIAILIGFSFSVLPALAGESQFASVYTTDLLPKGQHEIEQWITMRMKQQDGGSFSFIEGRTAYEYGLTDDYQVAFYARYGWALARKNGPFSETAPPEPFAFDQPGPDDTYRSAKLIGLSMENIYRVMSPYTDAVGFALYFEPTFGSRFAEFESRILLQKNFLDDTLICAFNVTVAPEFRLLTEAGVEGWQAETDANLGLGLSYRFRENWFAGFEALNENEYATLGLSNLVNSVYYLGPSIHYGAKDFFVTIAFLNQLPIAGEHGSTNPGTVVHGYDLDNDFEKLRIRIKTGFYF